jgi:hypothetical protein
VSPVSYKDFAQQMHGFFAMPAALPAAGKAMQWLAQEMDRHLTAAERKDVVIVGAGFSGHVPALQTAGAGA